MPIIYITGLSGVGKTSVLSSLAKQGYSVLDTDYGYTIEIEADGLVERVLNEKKLLQEIEKHKKTHLFISGCYSNQGRLYNNFDFIVLMKADLNVMLDRIDRRTCNDYGKDLNERAEVIESYKKILPLLEKSSGKIIDTTNIEIVEVCKELTALLF